MGDKLPYKRIKMLVTVIDRGKAEKLISELRWLGVTFNMASVGYHSVGMELTDYLGLTEDEYDVVFSIIPEDKAKTVISMIEYKFNLDEPNNGYAFTVPISGVSGPLALRYISGITDDEMKANEE